MYTDELCADYSSVLYLDTAVLARVLADSLGR